MDAVGGDHNVLDGLSYFGHGSFNMSVAETLTSGNLHQNHQLAHDFLSGDIATDSLNMDHHHHYYSGPNVDSNILDVSSGVIYDSFSSADVARSGEVESNSSMMTAASVVDAVASGAIVSAVSEPTLYSAERQNAQASNSTSPTDDKKSCTCKDCGKVFNSVWYLKQHAVKHSSERPFKCKYCHKTYRFRSNLYQHKCPLRDRASELALASVGVTNGKLDGDDIRKISTSTITDSPHPSSESSSSAELVAAASITRTRKRRAWPPLTSPPTSAMSMANGGDKHYKTNNKMRKGNQQVGILEPSIDGTLASSATRWDSNNRCAVSMSSSTGSPTSPMSLAHGSTKQSIFAKMSDEDIQKFLDRHKDKLHKCPRCKSLWPSREYLTRHMEWHNDDSSRFRCVQCSETFVDEQRYGLHKQNHSPSSLHVCGRCRGKFNTRVALRKHARRCSLADAKNNVIGGQTYQRSNSIANGYRPALFIDPTPPPSPATAVGEDDSMTSDEKTVPVAITDNQTDTGNPTIVAPVEEPSPTSSMGDVGVTMQPEFREGNSSTDAISAPLNHVIGSENNGNLNGRDFDTRSAAATTALAKVEKGNGSNEGLDAANDVMLSATVGEANESFSAAVLPEEGANTSFGAFGHLSSAPVARTWEPYELYDQRSVPLSDVPKDNLFPTICPSTTSNLAHNASWSSPVSELAQQSFVFHSSSWDYDHGGGGGGGGDECDWLLEHNFAHNNTNDWGESGRGSSYGLQLQHQRPYCYHGGFESQRLQSMKMATQHWSDEYLSPTPMIADTPSVALASIAPSESIDGYNNASARYTRLDEEHNLEALMNAVPVDFFNAKNSSLLSAVPSPAVLVEAASGRHSREYLHPVQANVPLEMMENDAMIYEKLLGETLDGAGTTLPRLNLVATGTVEMVEDAKMVSSHVSVAEAVACRTTDIHSQQHYCPTCSLYFINKSSYHDHWLRQHVLEEGTKTNRTGNTEKIDRKSEIRTVDSTPKGKSQRCAQLYSCKVCNRRFRSAVRMAKHESKCGAVRIWRELEKADDLPPETRTIPDVPKKADDRPVAPVTEQRDDESSDID